MIHINVHCEGYVPNMHDIFRWFCDGHGSLLCSKYSVGLDKIFMLFKIWRNQTAKAKDIVSDAKTRFF